MEAEGYPYYFEKLRPEEEAIVTAHFLSKSTSRDLGRYFLNLQMWDVTLVFSESGEQTDRREAADGQCQICWAPPPRLQHQAEAGGRLDRDPPQVWDHLGPGDCLEHREWGGGGDQC